MGKIRTHLVFGYDSMVLECTALSKWFGNVHALDGANLRVRPAAIHALVGENGAGKSTLINTISGLLRPDSGSVALDGKEVQFKSPLEAVRAGIGVVHQHYLLAEALTVAENISLGVRASQFGLAFDRKSAEAQVAALSEQTGLAIDPRARIADLPVALRQRVEILKALSRGAQLLLLDEPTAVLAPPEVESLFSVLRRLRESGRTIMIVTHKLDEVFALASDVTVLRKGKTVFAGELANLNPATLASKMVDANVSERSLQIAPQKQGGGSAALEIQNAAIANLLSIPQLRVNSGEIVGVAGVEGNGQQELAEIIAGTLPLTSGELALCGAPIQSLSVRERNRRGLSFIPADRQRDGLVLDFDLVENLFLREPLAQRIAGISILDRIAMQRSALEQLSIAGVVPPNPALPARALSGGNQQKVVVARELGAQPKFVLAYNPTRGLDFAAAEQVHARLVRAAREQNAGVLLISSDLDEVLKLSDRVTVLFGRNLSELGARGISREVVGRAMVGAAA